MPHLPTFVSSQMPSTACHRTVSSNLDRVCLSWCFLCSVPPQSTRKGDNSLLAETVFLRTFGAPCFGL